MPILVRFDIALFKARQMNFLVLLALLFFHILSSLLDPSCLYG